MVNQSVHISFFRETTSLLILLYINENKSKILYASKIAEDLHLKETYTMAEVDKLLKANLLIKDTSEKSKINKRIKVLKISPLGEKVIPHILSLKKYFSM